MDTPYESSLFHLLFMGKELFVVCRRRRVGWLSIHVYVHTLCSFWAAEFPKDLHLFRQRWGKWKEVSEWVSGWMDGCKLMAERIKKFLSPSSSLEVGSFHACSDPMAKSLKILFRWRERKEFFTADSPRWPFFPYDVVIIIRPSNAQIQVASRYTRGEKRKVHFLFNFFRLFFF